MTFQEALDNMDIKAVRKRVWFIDTWIELATVNTRYTINDNEMFRERDNDYCIFYTRNGREWIHTDLILLLSDTDDWEIVPEQTVWVNGVKTTEVS